MPTGRSRDTDPQAWFEAAHRINQARLANKAFQSGQRSLPVVISKPPLLCLVLTRAVLIPLAPKPLLPPSPMGVLMDIDATRRTRPLPPKACYQCGEVGHMVQDCPHRMDVWQLMLRP